MLLQPWFFVPFIDAHADEILGQHFLGLCNIHPQDLLVASLEAFGWWLGSWTPVDCSSRQRLAISSEISNLPRDCTRHSMRSGSCLAVVKCRAASCAKPGCSLLWLDFCAHCGCLLVACPCGLGCHLVVLQLWLWRRSMRCIFTIHPLRAERFPNWVLAGGYMACSRAAVICRSSQPQQLCTRQSVVHAQLHRTCILAQKAALLGSSYAAHWRMTVLAVVAYKPKLLLNSATMAANN